MRRLPPLVALGLAVLFGGISSAASATPIFFAPACTTGTLASYIALGGGATGGCSIDDEVRLFDFTFTVLSTGGGAVPISAAAITVTPTQVGDFRTITLTSAGFSVTGTQSVSYLITYTSDPHPILRGFGDTLLTNTPVFPGLATVTTNLCIGAPFGGTILVPTCGGISSSVSVFHNGTTFSLTDSTIFSAVADLGVRNTVTLNANGASSSITGFANVSQVTPEPMTVFLLGSGLAGLIASRAKARRRSLR